jgi:hypothetical protein
VFVEEFLKLVFPVPTLPYFDFRAEQSVDIPMTNTLMSSFWKLAMPAF